MSVEPVVHYASRTDVGMRRSANQDSLAVRLCTEYQEWATMGHLFVVADGMGGHSVGDLASRITVEALPLAFVKSGAETAAERVVGAIEAANRAINDRARENPEFSDMGTTCSVLALSASGAWIGHVGDSRVYRVRDSVIEQLTFDHSLQWEMIRQGKVTAENSELLHPRNVITRCLGPDRNVQIDVEGPFDIRAGDRFLLCSDGLTGHVSDPEIGAILENLPAAQASRLLIDLANCRGGADNTTVVIASVEDYPAVPHPTVESEAAQAEEKAVRQANRLPAAQRWSNFVMLLFVFLSISGLALMLAEYQSAGLAVVSAALLLGFVQLLATTRQRKLEDTAPSQPSIVSTTLPALGVREPASQTPYRRETAELWPEFLDLLAQAQGELTAAAQDNGWELDSTELSRLARDAAEARQDSSSSQGLPEYARALEILMKEFTSRMRPRG